MKQALRRLLVMIASVAVLAMLSPAQAANLTPDQLTQAVSIGNTDLFVLYPTGGPLKSVQYSVLQSNLTTALGSSFLRVSNNLTDLGSISAARTNLGLGTAAVINTGTSGHVLPFLDGANTWSAKQTLPASTTAAAPLNLGQGTPPTSPINGDCWITTAGMSCRVNGSTQTFGTSTGTVSSIATNNGLTGGTITTTGTIGLAAITANSALVNATALSAVPTAIGLPSCSATGSALLYTTSTGFSCGTGYAPLASPALTGSPTVGGSAIVTTNDARFGGAVQNSTCTYTLVLSDAGKQVYCQTAGTHTLTIPANASVAFPIGTFVNLVNDCSAGVWTISITTDTLVLYPAGTAGSRSVAACGDVTIKKLTANKWLITGVGVTWNTLSAPEWMTKTRRRPANDDGALDMAA